MKKLIIALLLCVSVITQAQQKDSTFVVDPDKFITGDDITTSKPISEVHYLVNEILKLNERIYELEKIVNRLYQKQQQDSIQYASEAWIREKERQGICVEIEPTRPDIIWIDSEMDFYNGKVPVVRLRKWRK